MSGVEAAGFILAVFPLLISAAEDYKEAFRPLRKWKRFRTEFIQFINAVEIERTLFSQMLQRFLLSANVPEEEVRLFIDKPEYEGWQRPDLAYALQSRLGLAYNAYMSSLDEMRKLVLELEDLLCKNGKVQWIRLSES
jgi:hypothetical protein